MGAHPLAKTASGTLASRIGTVFPRHKTLVTLPGIHATQHMAFITDLNASRKQAGLPPLSPDDEMLEWQNSVDLIMEDDSILIRPDPQNMALAFDADELLQELTSKQKIKYLNLLNEDVRLAIKKRGEYWRIAPLPRSPDEMKQMILSSKIPIGGRSIYYYSRDTGTRFLTLQQFSELGSLPEPELQAHLAEICNFSGRNNRMGNPEIAFFAAESSFGHFSFPPCNAQDTSADQIRQCFERIKNGFQAAVCSTLQKDDVEDPEWRNRMFLALLGKEGGPGPEELILGMSPEFFMQIEWLPGGRMEEGELIFDSLFEEFDRAPQSPDLRTLCDEKARGFIFNFVREFGDVEYVNVGRVIGSLSHRPSSAGRRDVYVAEIQQLNSTRPVVRILRMQKWGIREHLDEGKDLLTAIMESEEYTEYILDRRLGCRQLGMNLPPRITTRKISEDYRGQQIWSTYFERDYVSGIATDKIPRSRFQSASYAHKFAELMGRAAASNCVVGRMNLLNSVLFDDGDEILIEDAAGMPLEIVVSDPTGTFTNYLSELDEFSGAYAQPIKCRAACFSNPEEVMDSYVASFLERFQHLQRDYRMRKRSFDTLFKQRPRDERGSFAYRWERILARLDRTSAQGLAQAIRGQLTT